MVIVATMPHEWLYAGCTEKWTIPYLVGHLYITCYFPKFIKKMLHLERQSHMKDKANGSPNYLAWTKLILDRDLEDTIRDCPINEMYDFHNPYTVKCTLRKQSLYTSYTSLLFHCKVHVMLVKYH